MQTLCVSTSPAPDSSSAFCTDALAQRVADCRAKVVLTASGGMRGKKPIQLKQIVDKGLKQAEKLGAKVLFCSVVMQTGTLRQHGTLQLSCGLQAQMLMLLGWHA